MSEIKDIAIVGMGTAGGLATYKIVTEYKNAKIIAKKKGLKIIGSYN